MEMTDVCESTFAEVLARAEDGRGHDDDADQDHEDRAAGAARRQTLRSW